MYTGDNLTSKGITNLYEGWNNNTANVSQAFGSYLLNNISYMGLTGISYDDNGVNNGNKNNYQININWWLIGSSTNSSYEDLSRCASICKEASDAGLKAVIP